MLDLLTPVGVVPLLSGCLQTPYLLLALVAAATRAKGARLGVGGIGADQLDVLGVVPVASTPAAARGVPVVSLLAAVPLSCPAAASARGLGTSSASTPASAVGGVVGSRGTMDAACRPGPFTLAHILVVPFDGRELLPTVRALCCPLLIAIHFRSHPGGGPTIFAQHLGNWSSFLSSKARQYLLLPGIVVRAIG